MGRVNQMCCSVAVVGVLLASPYAISDGHKKDAEDADVTKPSDKAANEVARTPAPKLGPGLQRLADLAIADLTASLKVDAKVVEVVEAQFVTWRDSSAGCPRPGMQYLQVLTNGARIVLRVDGTIYHYHSGGSRPPLHCAKPSSIEPLPYSHGEA
jgi:hypothetical protein